MTSPGIAPNIARGQAVLAESRLLHDMFATDVQNYTPLLDDIAAALAKLDAPDHGHVHATPFTFTGNLYALTLHSRTAEIVNTRDRAVLPETIKLADFAAAFTVWRQEHRARD